MSFKYKVFIFLRKVFVIIILLSFFVNIFSNLPFNKIMANYTKDEIEEIILNEGYNEEVSQIYEMESERTPSSKVYKNSDGSHELIEYNNIIHEKTEDGYKEIDSTFKEETNEYSSSSIEYKVKLPKKIHDNKKIKLQYQSSKVEITYNGINKVEGTIKNNTSLDTLDLTRLSGTATYNNIYDGVDLELISTSSTLKENIILNKYIENFSFSYNISLTNLALYEEEGTIYLTREDNIIYQIDPYFMIDTEGLRSSDITLEIVPIKNNEYQIKVTPSDEWLSQATYPVVIDPILKYYQSTTNSKITIKEVTKGNTTPKLVDSVRVVKYYFFAYPEDGSVISNNLSTHSIMKIDISELPKDVMYTAGKLYMYQSSTTYTGHLVTLKEITSNISLDEINGHTTYYSKYLSTQTQVSGNLYSFDILDSVIGNLEDGIIYLDFSPEDLPQTEIEVAFYGMSSTTYKPYLTFKYVEANGLTDYWTYHSADTEEAGVAYINDYTGNLVITKQDYINTSMASSFNISHTYNSTSSLVNLGYGNGWRVNYAEIMDSFSTNYYKYTDGTGHVSYYKFDRILNENISESGLYLSEEGHDSHIEIGTSETDFYRRVVNGEYIYKYNWNRELIAIISLKNDETYDWISISYSELASGLRVISKIEDTYDNIATFTYENDLLTDIVITKQKYNDDNTFAKDENNEFIAEVAYRLEYEYDNDKNLISVKKYSKNSINAMSTVNYTYDSSNRLIEMKSVNKTSGNNLLTTFEYNDLNKVTEYSYIEGKDTFGKVINQYNITYATRKTKYTDRFDNEITYLFDRYGHTISLLDSDGFTKFYKYENENENNYLNNKLISSTEAIYSGYNIVENHGFEHSNSSAWTYVNDSSKIGLDTSNVVFGLKSLRITNDTSQYPYAYQTISLQGNKTYKIFGFIKTLELNGYESEGGYIEVSSET